MRQKLTAYIIKWVALSAMVFGSLQVSAQFDTVIISLPVIKEQAKKFNSLVIQAKLEESIASESYRQTATIFLPQVNVSYSAMVSNNPLNAFGFKLQQQIISQSDFSPSTLNEPDPTSDFYTRFSVQQPIWNTDAIFQRKAARRQAGMYTFKTKRTTEMVEWQVSQLYFRLILAWEGEGVLVKALETAKAGYKMVADRFAQGMVQRSDVVNAEAQVKLIETTLADAHSQIRNASDQMALLSGTDAGSIYKPLPDSVTSTMEDSVSENRADFLAFRQGIEAQDCMIGSVKGGYLPRLNGFADYQRHDSRALGFDGEGYLAGLQLSWDVFKGYTNRHKQKAMTIERDKMQEELKRQMEAGKAELAKAQRMYDDAIMKIKQSDLLTDYAEEALKIIRNRFAQGMVNTADLLGAQTQLASRRLDKAQAVYERNSALIYIQFLTKK